MHAAGFSSMNEWFVGFGAGVPTDRCGAKQRCYEQPTLTVQDASSLDPNTCAACGSAPRVWLVLPQAATHQVSICGVRFSYQWVVRDLSHCKAMCAISRTDFNARGRNTPAHSPLALRTL